MPGGSLCVLEEAHFTPRDTVQLIHQVTKKVPLLNVARVVEGSEQQQLCFFARSSVLEIAVLGKFTVLILWQVPMVELHHGP